MEQELANERRLEQERESLQGARKKLGADRRRFTRRALKFGAPSNLLDHENQKPVENVAPALAALRRKVQPRRRKQSSGGTRCIQGETFFGFSPSAKWPRLLISPPSGVSRNAHGKTPPAVEVGTSEESDVHRKDRIYMPIAATPGTTAL